MHLRVRASRLVAAGAPVTACVGQRTDGRRWAWYQKGSASGFGQEREVTELEAVPLPDGLSDEEAIQALRVWPAWRVVAVARLELGSRVLLRGSGWLLRPIVEVCSVIGCLSNAVSSKPPDSVIVLNPDGEALATALASCRDRGVVVAVHVDRSPADLNVYPDLHRRGIRLVSLSELSWDEASRQAWLKEASRLGGRIADRLESLR
jgi:D-arabinose 1-dehydrogenase-like Zn-dependent alcohol dehydrogenase